MPFSPINKPRRVTSHSSGYRLSVVAVVLAIASPGYSVPTLSLLGSAEVGGGYESNIFRRPAVMEDDTILPGTGGLPDTTTYTHTTVEGESFASVAAKVKGTMTVNTSSRFQLSVGGDYSPFPGLMAASQGQVLGGVEYRYRPVKTLSLSLQGDGGFVRKLAIDETADESADLYEYWQFGAGPHLKFEPSRTFSLDVAYSFTYRDYAPPDSGHSLDNQQHEAVVAIAPQFGKEARSTVAIEGSYIFKKYRELLSYDAGGSLDSTVRAYHYLSLSLGYRHDFNDVTWECADRPRYRIDAFDNFYTYFENRISTGLTINAFSRNSRISVDGAWRYRIYTVHEALRPGTNPNLKMNYFDAGARLRQRLWKMLFLALEYDLVARTTNTGYLSYHTYREYLDHSVKGGVRVEW